MEHNDTIEQGATFYREVPLFSDKAKTVELDITGKTVRATLMTLDGTLAANFACAIITPDPARIAWTMPRATTATLDPDTQYIYCVDLDDATDPEDVQTDRAMHGTISVERGQVPVAE